jgi:hypothetical protein
MCHFIVCDVGGTLLVVQRSGTTESGRTCKRLNPFARMMEW